MSYSATISKWIDQLSKSRYAVFILLAKDALDLIREILWPIIAKLYNLLASATGKGSPISIDVTFDYDMMDQIISFAVMLIIVLILYGLLGRINEYRLEIDTHKSSQEHLKKELQFLRMLASIRRKTIESLHINIETLKSVVPSGTTKLSHIQTDPMRKEFFEAERELVLTQLEEMWDVKSVAKKYVDEFYKESE